MRTEWLVFAAVCLVSGSACKGGESAKTPEGEPPPGLLKKGRANDPDVKHGRPKVVSVEAQVARVDECLGFAVAGEKTKLAGCYRSKEVAEIVGHASFEGNSEIAEGLVQFMSAFSEVKLEPQLVLARNGRTVEVVWFHGKNTGPFMGAPATNQPVSVLLLRSVVVDSDGQWLAGDRFFIDLATVSAQLSGARVPHRPVADAAPGPVAWAKQADGPNDGVDAGRVSNFCDALSQHQLPEALELLADDVLIADQTAPADVRGKAAAEKALGELLTAFPDLDRNCPVAYVGDYVFADVTWTGTHDGDYRGMAKTGKKVAMHDKELFRFKDGKITEYWRFSNGSALLAQLSR